VCFVDLSNQDLNLQQLNPLDLTASICQISIEGIKLDQGSVIKIPSDSSKRLQGVFNQYLVSLTSMMVGAMDEVVNTSVEYANVRAQYGQPIGRFQAVKHRIVNMKVELETSKSLLYYAAWAIENQDPQADIAISAAKSFASEAFTKVAGDNIQNHGANGYSWEYNCHLYLKRAKSWEDYMGSPMEHRQKISQYFLDR